MYRHLTREQRYVIYLELQRGTSQEVIAQLIDVSKSTVSREIRRNSTKNGKYVWFKAQDKEEARSGQQKPFSSYALAYKTAHN